MTYSEKCALIEKAYGTHDVKKFFELVDAAFAAGEAEARQEIMATAKYIPADVAHGDGAYLVNERQLLILGPDKETL